MRDITCPEDLDRLPACPSCQQLSRDLAAARRERDRLLEALEQVARHASQEHYNDNDALAATLRHIDRVARAALEKANG